MDKSNDLISGVGYARGDLPRLSGFLYGENGPANFMISGGAGSDSRYYPLYGFLQSFIGRGPIIIMHNNDSLLEEMVEGIYDEEERDTPLWITHTENPEYEPFYGMTDMQILMTLKKIADKLGYTVAPQFEKIARAHMEIMRYAGIENSLSGFYYLAQFHDMEEFHRNVMSLPCDEKDARRIWAAIGMDQNDTNGQLDLFRAVVNALAYDANQSGWDEGSPISELNCKQAIDQGATMLFSINTMYTDTLLTYITEELKAVDPRKHYILVVDDLVLDDDGFKDYLRSAGNCHLGIVSQDAVSMFKGSREEFLAFTEKLKKFIFFKHGTGETASYLSEIMGNYDRTKMETSTGRTKNPFGFLPTSQNDNTSFTTENRNRVMPEDIIGLNDGQAIIFDASNNQIIYYN